MGKVRIELNSPGIRALLRCPEMQAVLKDRADTVKDRCGDGYESYVAPTRAVAVVETASRKAYDDNCHHSGELPEKEMIEEVILNYLRENAFSCYMSMPEKPSGNFCILEKTGDSPDEGIYTATLAVQSYGSSDFSAAQLSHFVVQAMLDADTLPEIVSCDLVTEYNFPDTTRKRPRYQAVFSITHY